MIKRCCLAVGLLCAILAVPATGAEGTRPDRKDGKNVYIVELSAPPLALSRTGSRESLQYVEDLRRSQRDTLAAVRATVGREVPVHHQYTRAFNGMALELTAEEAGRIATLPGVRRVHAEVKYRLQSDAGPAWIGAPGIWDGTQTGGFPGTKGEGVVIGIIDSGINMDHPSFADVGGDGYNHTNPRGAGNYVGWCNPSNPDYDPSYVCNDKLIGVWAYPSWNNPEDTNGHGSQLASVAAGNVVNVPVTGGLMRTISGAAPHANLIAYNACGYYNYCYSSEVLAAIDQAVADGVDVLNLSFASGSYSSPWEDSVSQALLAAREAGIFIASAAGNGGSYEGSISSPASAPWVLSVGATTHNRRFSSTFRGLSGGSNPPPVVSGLSWTPPTIAGQVVKAGGTGSCYSSYPAGTFTGKIVACMVSPHETGQSAVDIAKAAGALGVVLVDDHTHPDEVKFPMDYGHPTVHLVDDANINAFWNWMGIGSGHSGQIEGTAAALSSSYADMVPWFSGHGPGAEGDVLRPDVLAPGFDILSASSDNFGDFEVSYGTSLSSALAAGAAALLIDLHPGWTPGEVQSAMMTTAKATGLRDYLGAALTNPLAIGSGRLNLGAAAKAGLVFDESAADFLAADPDANGAPQLLNLPSLANDKCVLSCGWSRTVRNTLPVTTNWIVSSVATPAGTSATIVPFSFTLPPGGTQTIGIHLSGPASQYGWASGSVILSESANLAPPVRMPIATRWVPQYQLTVVKQGTGSGKVTSQPAGIDCGPTCSALYPDETTVQLTPAADPGSAFVGWSSWDCDGLENPCHVDVDGYAPQVTAYFDVQPADRPLANRTGFKDFMNPPVYYGTWRYYYADVPAGTGELVVDVLDLKGEVTLFVGLGSKPDWDDYDCYDYDYYGLPNLRCAITSPAAGRWWIAVNNEQTGPIQYTVRASWGSSSDQALANGVPMADFVSSEAAGADWKYYYVDLAGGDTDLVVDLVNLSADADLFVRFGAKPDRSNYGCTSAAVSTGSERCTMPNPAAGRWWIGVNNFSPGTVTYDVKASWSGAEASDFYTVVPCRLIDTRQSQPLQANQPRDFLVAGHCGVPAT
ncbi:MAG TPA: S8 family serine peptidase, partial [Thermoanaerobaculia bacterium]|nr:S8 family serine peptidase [Thermoanaerobaculia bacterium]